MKSPRNLSELQDYTAVRALLHEFAHFLDTKQWKAYTALFAPEGVLTVPGADPIAKPELAEAAARQLDGFAHTQHVVTNTNILIKESAATVTADRHAMYVSGAHSTRTCLPIV